MRNTQVQGSLIDGSSQAPSVTHRNGEACDFRYIGKNNAHRTNAIWTQNNDYDEQRNITLVRELRKFGFTVFYTRMVIIRNLKSQVQAMQKIIITIYILAHACLKSRIFNNV
jgi:hypothetical protein